jgi:hypothetical protein
MTKLFLYVVKSSPDPNDVNCLVPWRIDDKEIFFGPCMRSLRRKLRHQYLGELNIIHPNEDIFLVGVNGSNSKRIRKILVAYTP